MALLWKRGEGYFGAHKHKRPLPWREFRDEVGQPLEIAKSRYVSYLISWCLHHGADLTESDLSDDSAVAGRIAERVRAEVQGEINRQEEVGDKPKRRKTNR